MSSPGPSSGPGHHGPTIIVSRRQKALATPHHAPAGTPHAAPPVPKQPNVVWQLAKHYKGYILGAAGLAAVASGYFGWVAPELEEREQDEIAEHAEEERANLEKQKPFEQIILKAKLWLADGHLMSSIDPHVVVDGTGTPRVSKLTWQEFDATSENIRGVGLITVTSADGTEVSYTTELVFASSEAQEQEIKAQLNPK
ncbi:MAG: hypothetical protein AAB588_06030 [Patescibacteria group bacterium]